MPISMGTPTRFSSPRGIEFTRSCVLRFETCWRRDDAPREEKVMDKKKVSIGVVVALLVMVCGAWAMGYFHGTDPAFAELQQLRDQMRSAPEADRQALRDQFRQKMDGLSEDQRRSFFESNRGQFRQEQAKRMAEFFAMSPADQKKRLDEIIDQMQKRQKERAAAGANGGGRWRRPRWRCGRRWRPRQSTEHDCRPARTGSQGSTRQQQSCRARQQDKFRQMMGDRMQARGITPPGGVGGGGFGMGRRG